MNDEMLELMMSSTRGGEERPGAQMPEGEEGSTRARSRSTSAATSSRSWCSS